MHHCFTDYILAHLEKSLYMVDIDDELAAVSAEEREQTWRQENLHPCRTTCPGQLRLNVEDGPSDDDDPDYHLRDITNGEVTVFGMQTRQTTRSSSTSLTPQLSNLDVGRHAPPLWLQDTSPTLTPTTASGPPLPLVLPEVPVEPIENNNWPQAGTDRPQFLNFQEFENSVNQTRVAAILANDKSFSLTAGSVRAAARGLVNAIKGVKQDRHVRLAPYQATNNTEPDPYFYLTEPAEVTLSTWFSWGDWMFQA